MEEWMLQHNAKDLDICLYAWGDNMKFTVESQSP